MSFPALAITDASHMFDPIREYYRVFPQEVTHFSSLNLSITLPVISIANMTFESLVNTMIARSGQADNRFLVVAHGLTDPALGPVGLTMRLTNDTDIRARQEVFEALESMMDDGLSESEQREIERDLIPVPAGRRMPAGTLRRLNDRLTVLRRLRLDRVEFRACALGANRPVLGTLGVILGTDFVGAPDVHMFYAPINPGTHFRRVQDFERWERNHAGATRFTDSSSGDLFAMRINGTGPHRSTDAATTSSDLSWFVEENIMASSNYPSGRHEPARFVMAGIDLSGTPSFAPPLDPSYAGHIVLLGPLLRV